MEKFLVLRSAIESKTAFAFCERCASSENFPHLVHQCVLEALAWYCSSIIVIMRSMLFMRADCAVSVPHSALAADSIILLNPFGVTEMSEEFSV